MGGGDSLCILGLFSSSLIKLPLSQLMSFLAFTVFSPDEITSLMSGRSERAAGWVLSCWLGSTHHNFLAYIERTEERHLDGL